MRDICRCESNGCQAKGGVQLDTRTIQKHRCKDQLQLFEIAKADSEHALEEQLHHISLHLSKFRLSDSPAQTTSTTSDPRDQIANLSLSKFPLMDSPAQSSSTTSDLCHQLANLSLSKSPLTDSPAQSSSTTIDLCHQLANLSLSKLPLTDSPAQSSSTTNDLCYKPTNLSPNLNEASSTKDRYSTTPSPSQHSAIQDVLTHLSNIEAAATALQCNTASAFNNSINVSYSTLDPLLIDCYSLQASLSKVTLKAAPVTAMKEDISEILSKVKVQLEVAKSELVKKQKLAPRPAAPVYLTGMAFIEFIYDI